MTPSKFELDVGEVSAMEARVVVRYRPAKENQGRTILRGTLRGPYCDTARTLPAEFPFHNQDSVTQPSAEAIVPDPCLWSPDLPHLYHADVEALRGAQIIAEYHGKIGLRSTSPIRVHE
ncbi:MAG TPA: hypothetical protein VGM76_05795 [Lacipirellulaceae bacterium]|jgi:hypothetical protein